MDFEYSDRTKALVEKLNKFMDEVIYPAEPVYEEQMEKAKDRWQLPPIIEQCKAEAKKRGLWNMFLPGRSRDRRHARHDGPLQPRIRADLRSAGPLLDRVRSRSTARRPTPATWKCSPATAPRSTRRSG